MNDFVTSRIWVLTLGVINTFVLGSAASSESTPLLVIGSIGLGATIVVALIADAKTFAKEGE